MALIFDIPQLNPLKFYNQRDVFNENTPFVNESYNPNYNFTHIDADFYSRNIMTWQQENKYFQPYQNADVIPIFFAGESRNDYNYNIIDCNGKVVKTGAIASTGVVNSIDIFHIGIDLLDVPSGIYFIQISCANDADSSNYYAISEPIEVKEYHEGTMLLEYYNSYNDQSIIWGLMPNTAFQFRIHSALIEMNPQSKNYVYEDQMYNSTLLSGIAYREWIIAFGGDGHAIPQYIADKINRIFNCDNVSIDGVQYTRIEGSQLDPQRDPISTLTAWTLKVREKEVNKDTFRSNNYECKLWQMPDTAEFYVKEIGATSIEKNFKGVNHFLSFLNNTFLPTFMSSIVGKFYIDSNNFIHFKSEIAANVTSINGITIGGVLPYMLELEFDLTSGNPLDYIISGGTAIAMITNDFANETINHTTHSGFYNLIYTPNASGTKIVKCKIFFDDATDLEDSTGTGINYIGGELPASMTNLINIGFNNNFILNNNIFLRCNGALSQLQFYYNGLITSIHNQLVINLHEALKNNSLNLTVGSTYQANGTFSPPSETDGMLLLITELRDNNFSIII
jgi:hypothetical protein